MPRAATAFLIVIALVVLGFVGIEVYKSSQPRNTRVQPALEKAPLPELAPGPSDPDAPAEFSVTESGLKYKILRKSEGTKPHAKSTVRAYYRGWLDDGTEFDSSYKQGKSTLLRVEAVIPGWQEGLQLIGEGGMIELEIPYQLGYGSKGNPPVIPPRATLHFLIEVKKVR